MRAGNADREKVVARLNTAFAEGRLDVGELDERVAAAYAAKTLGELVPLTADLPAEPGYRPAPGTTPVPRPARPVAASGSDRWAPVGGALGLFLVSVLIWAVISVSSGELTYFWPVWTAIPLVFTVAGALGQRRR